MLFIVNCISCDLCPYIRNSCRINCDLYRAALGNQIGICSCDIFPFIHCLISFRNLIGTNDIRILYPCIFECVNSKLQVDIRYDSRCDSLHQHHLCNHTASHLTGTNVPDDLSRQMRASYYFLGALLSRFGKAQVAMPGGCNLGPRPIDQHLKVFSALGAEDSVDYGMITVRAKEMNGAHIFFDKVSVGATMNGMLSAVMAKGQTILENCAKEPHVVDLANFLNMCGANIRGAGTDVIKVRGVEKMHGCTYSIIPDQIEAGSYMVAAAATGGDVLVKNVTPKHLEPITEKLRRAGVEVEEFDDAVRVRRTGDILPLKINTMPHPGFPTDMQPLMGVLLSVAKGTSTVTESVWDNRFRYVDELRKMGANVQVDGQVAVFEGVDKLTPAPLRALDLRAGAAMVVAALMADGTSEIEEIGHIERGYENIVEKLRGLGADISKVERMPAALDQAL